MKIFEGKSPTERNKIIAAVFLGALALFAIGYNVIGFFPSRKTTVTVTTSPTPTPLGSPNRGDTQISALPTEEETQFTYSTTPVIYPGAPYAPDPGRNIFAFYEPPPPTPYSPTPYKMPEMTPMKTPTPAPPPPILISFVMPQSVYAGSKTFRLEVNGDKFTTDSVIYFNGAQLPTTYVSAQKLVADVPSNFIGGAGQLNIEVRTPGGLYSNQAFLMVQAPPTPQFLYVGAKMTQRNNNNTAYFREQGRTEFGARLNDVVAGRFRLMSISTSEVIFEDVSLGFKHRLALYRPRPGEITTTQNPYVTTPNYTPPVQSFDGLNPSITNPQIYNPTMPQQPPVRPQNPTRNPSTNPPTNPPPVMPNKDPDDDDPDS